MFSQSAQTPRSLPCRRDHLAHEQLGRVIDGGELELLLGAEVSEEAALAHPGRFREPADRQRLEALFGREGGGGVEDRLPRPLSLRLQHDRPILAPSDPRYQH
jgi:hypothetical protein